MMSSIAGPKSALRALTSNRSAAPTRASAACSGVAKVLTAAVGAGAPGSAPVATGVAPLRPVALTHMNATAPSATSEPPKKCREMKVGLIGLLLCFVVVVSVTDARHHGCHRHGCRRRRRLD